MVLYCSSFSKVLSPGYRVGWCLPGRFHRQMINDFLGRNVSISSLPQYVLSEFLRKNYYTQHTARLSALFADQAHKMTAAVEKHFPAQTRISQPNGGFIYWVQLPVAIDMEKLYTESLQAGVSIAPGAVFYASGTCNTAFRLCVGQPWNYKVDHAMAVLGALCSRLSMASSPPPTSGKAID